MFKLAGFFCIIAGCIGWGISKITEEQSRIRHLRELIRIIKRMQDEISYGKHTLPEICLILSEYCDVLYRPYFCHVYEHINQCEGAGFEQVWEEQMCQCLREAPLTGEEKNILINLPQNLGLQEEKLQAQSIGQSMDLLNRRCRQAEDAYENRAKMLLSVSVLAGVFLTILLL